MTAIDRKPEWEKETLNQYFRMHDKVWRLKTMREEYEPRLNSVIKQVTKTTKVSWRHSTL